MGKRGPKPTPTPILRLRGSRLADSRHDTPGLPSEIPECKELHNSAQEHWDRQIKILQEMKVLTRADGEALARYCYLLAAWDRLTAQFDSLPVDEWIHHAMKLAPGLSKLEACFGFTPADRTRVSVNRKEDVGTKENKKERFLG